MKFGKRKRLENVGDDTKTLKILGKGEAKRRKMYGYESRQIGGETRLEN